VTNSKRKLVVRDPLPHPKQGLRGARGVWNVQLGPERPGQDGGQVRQCSAWRRCYRRRHDRPPPRTSLMITSKTIAPIVALRIEAKMPEPKAM
jgi:hypothetical protein